MPTSPRSTRKQRGWRQVTRGQFTTALHDAERRYLDVMAELYRRDALPGVEACECYPLEGMHASLQALVARKAALEKEKL